MIRDARDADKVARLLKVWQQRLSYRLVRSAEESKIALSGREACTAELPFISAGLATDINQLGLESALNQPLARILEQVQLALDNDKERPDVIYLTGGAPARRLFVKRSANSCRGLRLRVVTTSVPLPPVLPAGLRSCLPEIASNLEKAGIDSAAFSS